MKNNKDSEGGSISRMFSMNKRRKGLIVEDPVARAESLIPENNHFQNSAVEVHKIYKRTSTNDPHRERIKRN